MDVESYVVKLTAEEAVTLHVALDHYIKENFSQGRDTKRFRFLSSQFKELAHTLGVKSDNCPCPKCSR